MANFEDSLDVVGGGDALQTIQVETEEDDLDLLADDDIVLGCKRLFLLPFNHIWQYSILFVAVCQIYLSIYKAGFRKYGINDGLGIDFPEIKYIASAMYMIDILLIIGCKNMHGLHISPSEIRYPNWVLLADFISILPLEVLIPMEPLTPFKAKFYYVIQLNNCLKLIRIYDTFQYTHTGVGNSKVYLQIFEYYFFMGLAIMVGFVVTCQIMCLKNKCPDTLSLEQYFNCMYTSVSQITARGITGYPDDLLWMLVMSIIGYIVFMGVICGSTAYVTIALYAKLYYQYDFLNKLKLMNLEFERMKVPKSMTNTCMKFFDMFWKNRTGYADDSQNFRVMPQSMSEEISLDISWYGLKHSKLLRNMDIPFLRHVSLVVQSKFVIPGEVVYNKNYTKNRMIYVVSGVIQILSEEDDDTPIFSFSAGTCLGESSLILNYNPKATVRCKTFCVLQVLEAKKFVKLMQLFPQHFAKMRQDFDERLNVAQRYHELSSSIKHNHGIVERTDYITIMWLKATLHRLMMKDGDASLGHQCQNIFLRDEFDEEKFVDRHFTAKNLDMLAISERLELITDTVFLKTSCPCVFQPASVILNTWEAMIMLFAVANAVLVPYFALVEPSTPLWYHVWVYIITTLWLLDLYVQVSTAVRRSGEIVADVVRIYLIRMGYPGFLVDLLAAVPLYFLSSIILWKITPQYSALLHLNHVIKIWRVHAIFREWEQQLNANLILIRYFKYCCLLCFTAYMCSCLLFSINCFDFVCVFYVTSDSTLVQLLWCGEIVTHILTGVSTPSRLFDKSMYYNSFLCLTLLSTAFFVFIYGSLAAEYGLQRASRNKLCKIITDIVSVVKIRGLSEKYDERILAYMETQWMENHALALLYKESPFEALPPHIYGLLKETTHRDVLLRVPLFQELPDKVVLDICMALKTVILPPEEVVCYTGDVCRTFHIIENGCCKTVCDVTGKAQSVLGPGDSISTLEACLRAPVLQTVVTITHCRLVTIDYETLNHIYLKYFVHQKEVENALEEADVLNQLELISRSNPFGSRFVVIRKDKRKHSFCNFGYNIEADTYEEYDYYVPFDRLGFLSFVQYFLLRCTILPEGKFLYRWEISRCVCAVLSALFFSFVGIGTCTNCDWYFLLAMLDGMAWIDIYLRFHTCYYNEDGVLVTHPLKTATYYLQHGFMVDFIAVFPVHMFFPVGHRHYNQALTLLQLNRLLQMHRYVGFFNYIEMRTFLPTKVLSIAKYFPIILILCVCVGSALITVICDFSEDNPASDIFTKGVKCMDKTWITSSKFKKPLSPARVQVYGVYFVTGIMTLAGMTGYKIRTTIIALFGLPLAFVAYILNAHIVSTAISQYAAGYSTVLEYQDSMNVVRKFMKNFKIKTDVQKTLIGFFELNWNRKRGMEVYESIARFHRPLQQDILYDIYGKTLCDAFVFTVDCKAFVLNLLLELSHDVSTKGHSIIAVNDITKWMYILYKGKVDIFAPDGSKLATLRPGGLFGNLDDIDMMRQTVSVVALTDVEILSVESLRFHAVLKNFPRLQKQYMQLIALHVDYLEGRGRVAREDETRAPVISRSPMLSPYDAMRKAVFYPKSVFIRIWQSFILVVVCYIEVCFGLYQMAVAEYALEFILFQYVCDVLYAVNYYVKAHTAYENKIGVTVTDLKMIKKRLFQDRVTLWCDIISIVPFDVLAWFSSPSTFRILHPILRLNRLLRLAYVIYHFRQQKRKLTINLHVLRYTYITLWSTFILHLCTCILITLSCTHTPNMHPDINCKDISLSPYEKLKIYVRFFYATISSFRCASQDSSYPESLCLIIYCILMMIFLQLVSATFLAQIYSAIRKGYRVQYKYAQHLERTRNFMERERLSESLFMKAYEYLRFLWRWRRGASFPRLLAVAPHRFREPILNSAFAHHINNHFIFEKCHVDFNRQIVAFLRNETYFRDDYIVFQGTINKSMYFVHSGEVVVLTADSSLKETIVAVVRPGMAFGVAQGLFSDKPHSYTFRAKKTSVILYLYLDTWKHLLRFFPASKAMIGARYIQFDDSYE